jgi:DNA polymerase-3 subunit beta
MNVTCMQDQLAKGLSMVGRAVSTRSTLPVLGNVLLATDDGRLKLSATNLEIVITCWLEANIEEEGATTIPARTLNDLVNALPQERVHLSLNRQTETLHVQCARTEANIKGIDFQEFPIVPEPSPFNRIQLETAAFKEMITQTTFAAATDDARPTLTGVNTTFDGNKLTMAATDGFRLSVRSAGLSGFAGQPFSVIIPARALNEVARVVSDDAEAIYVSMPEGRNQIIFDMGNVVVVSQLIDGNFPDFNPVVPKKHNTRSVLSTADFLKACKTADIFAREASHTARVRIEPGDGLMPGYATITAISSETGDNVAQIDANVEGTAVEVAFNVKYMTDLLSVVNTPQVALETTTSTDPGVLKPVGKEGFFHIIMPMHFGR